jgi:hypothetical protein
LTQNIAGCEVLDPRGRNDQTIGADLRHIAATEAA